MPYIELCVYVYRMACEKKFEGGGGGRSMVTLVFHYYILLAVYISTGQTEFTLWGIFELQVN